MLPYPHDRPATRCQFGICLAVSFNVTVKLLLPPIAIRSWNKTMIGAAMPETAVNHHHDPGTAEQDVSPPAAGSQQRNVHPVSQAATVKLAAKCHLRSGVADLLTLKPGANRRRQRARSSRSRHYLIVPSAALNSGYDHTSRC